MRGFVIEIQPDGGAFYQHTETGRSAYVGVITPAYRAQLGRAGKMATHFVACKDEHSEVVASGESNRRTCGNIAVKFVLQGT